MQLFTYGTLMFAPVWQSVVGRNCAGTPAWLDGFRREGVHGAPYPVILPDSQAKRLEGLLYRGLRHSDLKRLDDYEGHLYRRQTVAVWSPELGEVRAQTYVLRPQWRRLASGRAWNPGAYQSQRMRPY